jgi:hypothetical protein
MPVRRHLTVEEASRAIGFLQTGHEGRTAGFLACKPDAWSRFLTVWVEIRSPDAARRSLFNVTADDIRFRFYGHVNNRLIVYNGDQKVADLKVRKAHQDRRIALLAKRNRMSSAVTLNRDLRAASGDRISTQTVRNRLHASGLPIMFSHTTVLKSFILLPPNSSSTIMKI